MKKWTKQEILRELKSWVLLIAVALFIKTTVVAAYLVPTGSMENTIMTGDFLIGTQFVYGFHSPDYIKIPFTKIGTDLPTFRTTGFKKPKQDDIIIFRYPEDHSLNYVKRCVAGPGQVVNIQNKKLMVDNVPYPLPENSKFIRPVIYPQSWNSPEIFPRANGNEDNYKKLYIPAKGDTLFFDQFSVDYIRNVVELNRDEFAYKNGQILINDHTADFYVTEQNYYFMMGDNRDNSLDSRYWGFVPEKMIMGQPLMVLLSFNFDKVPMSRPWEKIRWSRIGKLPR